MRTTPLSALCLSSPRSSARRAAIADPSPPDVSETKASNPALGARWQYPREREKDGRKVIVYAPQIRTWDEFKHFTAQVAVEFLAEDASARYGVIDLSGETTVNRETRIVSVPKPKVDGVTFSGGKGSAEHENRIRTVGGERAARNSARRVPLLPRRWRTGISAAVRIQRRRAADLRGGVAGLPALHQRRAVCDGGGQHRPRGDRQREFPGFPRHEDRKLLPALRRSSLHVGETRRALGHGRRAAAGIRQDSRERRIRVDRGRRCDAAEGRRRARHHHDLQAGRDRRARRQAAGPRDRGHRRPRVHREHREPAVPSRRHVLPAGRGPLVLDEGSCAWTVEVHDAIAGCVRAHPGRR